VSHKCTVANSAVTDKTMPFKAASYLGLHYFAINDIPEKSVSEKTVNLIFSEIF